MNEMVNKINLRFESGNSVPVDSVRITREDWDSVMAERAAALKREQALAAHVERIVGYGTELLNVEDVEDEEDAASIHMRFNDAVLAAPDVSLARRDLIKQAEALEEVGHDELAYKVDKPILLRKANQLRQRAQELK